MLVFIDESGDPGFKILRGSSPHFVIALVVFDEDLNAEEAALKIKKLRKSLKKPYSFEFKFNKCNRKLRTAFLSEIRSTTYRIRAIVFNKETMYSAHLRNNKEDFYNFALRQVLEHNNKTIKNAKIRIDGRGERAFRQQLTKYLRQSLNSQTKIVMKNVRFRDSKKDVLIQMADMIAGSLRRYYDKNTTDWNIYRKIIKHQEEDVWEFK
ncbi:hypothetical protein COU87_04125 [Candidatus Roizmanbacteria bacterium CG10_big_fil_rev_8_21_14_0_10_39_12]|uniref:DUF3800 domain-containing protein n=1 Tax=Candidatus Roizmanbacteria bacterium CG10_big_fil_rev_8_21_14_0_10_39_12 TaxID=1974852 RepID=A0A2M8KNN8_9BACT|nr:MAG: hypothetical protein COU87_04125 [Candidatus Roizmanbacteria bacterium CG10_big_fil_rev_8_21_14_0_10_39_12]